MTKIRIVNKKISIPVQDPNALQRALSFTEESLHDIGANRKLIMRTVLLAEELIPQFIENAQAGTELKINIRKFFGDTSILISSRGSEFDPMKTPLSQTENLDDLTDEDAQHAIRSIFLKSQGDKLKISHKLGTNFARILVGESEKSVTMMTVSALVLGLLIGYLLNISGIPSLTEGISTYILNPGKTIFLNALNIVIGPVVFFSIVSCLSQFKDLRELGRIAVKVLFTYLCTTLVAIAIGYFTFMILKPGTPGFVAGFASEAAPVNIDTNIDTSLLNTLITIVPSNLLLPFVESNTLQIIFLAVLIGIALNSIGDYAPILRDFFEACNSLFLTITTIIARFIPVAVFCSTAIMMMDMQMETLYSILSYFVVFVIALLAMMIFYGMIIMVIGRLNPITFFKKAREGMLTSFTLCSSSAAMPTNMRVCTEKLGISPKIANFSIPLGATINMDGYTILLLITGLFFARGYGITITAAELASLIITIILLSVGTPGVPGSGLVCMCIVLKCIGVPIEVIGLIIGINPFIDMFDTMSNTTGDMAATLIVAKSEGLVDEEVYNS